MSEFVDQHHVRMSGEHRVDVEFIEVRPAVAHAPGRDALQCGQHGRGVGSVMGLNERRDHVDALPRKAIGFGQHRKGLAYPRGGAEVDMQPPAR